MFRRCFLQCNNGLSFIFSQHWSKTSTWCHYALLGCLQILTEPKNSAEKTTVCSWTGDLQDTVGPSVAGVSAVSDVRTSVCLISLISLVFLCL